MTTSRTEQTAAAKPRAQRLSPELNEFLHMLTALEQQAPPASAAPSTR